MKISHLLAAVFIVVLALPTNAYAVSIHLDNEISYDSVIKKGKTIRDGNHGVVVTDNSSGTTVYDYTVSGVLKKMTEISITFEAKGVKKDFDLDAGKAPPATLPKGVYPTLFLSDLKVVPTTSHKKNYFYTLTIENWTDKVESFTARFYAIIKQGQGGGVKIRYEASAVPLPPSFLLFASGLIALAGFAAYKKVGGQA